MERIKLLTEETAAEGAKPILLDFKAKMGKVINIFKAMGNSSAVLKTYVGITGALQNSTIDGATSERIAIRMAVLNGCDYCFAAHSYLGSQVLSKEEVIASREGKSSDKKAEAALKFAELVMKKAGKVSDEEFEEVRNAGYTDAEILEIVTNVSLNFFTNAINNVSQTKVDFPKPKD